MLRFHFCCPHSLFHPRFISRSKYRAFCTQDVSSTWQEVQFCEITFRRDLHQRENRNSIRMIVIDHI